MPNEPALFETDIKSLQLLHRGKVRDIYVVDDGYLLLIQTDRLSAFDVILPTAVPGKGKLLTALSAFWFNKLEHIMPNHLTGILPESVVSAAEREQVAGRAFVVKRLKPLPIEAIVRGYIAGSGWKDYQKKGAICDIKLPEGLQEAEKLPDGAIFSPSTKAKTDAHDENIPFESVITLLGKALAEKIREQSIRLYTESANYAASRNIIIADTKFEFGLDNEGQLFLIDEVLTPDSSRFWPACQYVVGKNPPSYDKQFIRDWLEGQAWNKKAPAPIIPPEILNQTRKKYQEALRLLTE